MFILKNLGLVWKWDQIFLESHPNIKGIITRSRNNMVVLKQKLKKKKTENLPKKVKQRGFLKCEYAQIEHNREDCGAG